MGELLETVFGILRGVWRFRWTALLTAWAVCLVGWMVVLVLPDEYEASARVFVDPSTALKPVIEGLAIEQDMNAELNFVRQSLLGGAQLSKIVGETGLDIGAETPAERAARVDALRKRINIATQSNQPSDNRQAPSRVYTITYRDAERERSLRVVQILLDTFVEGTLGGKRQGSINAQKFVERQIRDYEARLSAAEQRLADFKKQNVGMVPGEQRADYFTRLQAEMDAVKTTQDLLRVAQARRATLEQQLRGEAPIAASAGAPVVPGSSGSQGGDTLSRIKETQAKLDELLLRFTDRHPDVIALRETLGRLQERREAELQALKRGDAGAAALTGASANPVYQSIQLSLNQASVEIATLQSQLNDHQRKVAELRQVVDTVPQVEAEYARLNRDYTVTKAQYTALVERLEKARLGEEAEATGSVRFDVIDPPSAGFNPVSPKRTLLLAVVLCLGLGAGAGLAYLLDLMRPVFLDARTLAEQTGAVVLGVVGITRSAAEMAGVRRRFVGYALACALLLVALIAVLLVGSRLSTLGTAFLTT